MFLKNNYIIFKIRRSKVTDYAALKYPRSQIILLLKSQAFKNSLKTNTTLSRLSAAVCFLKDVAVDNIYDFLEACSADFDEMPLRCMMILRAIHSSLIHISHASIYMP